MLLPQMAHGVVVRPEEGPGAVEGDGGGGGDDVHLSNPLAISMHYSNQLKDED